MTVRLALSALRPALHVTALCASALALVAAFVLAGGDGRCFTAPPESVAEQFVRKLALGRFAPARDHLTAEMAAATGPGSLRAVTRSFEDRFGRIEQVEGRALGQAGDSAVASAVVTTSQRARVEVVVPLTRRRGVWRVAGLEGLAAVR